jgi:hypothetical protein
MIIEEATQQCQDLGFDEIKRPLNFPNFICVTKANYDKTIGEYNYCYMPLSENINVHNWCEIEK